MTSIYRYKMNVVLNLLLRCEIKLTVNATALFTSRITSILHPTGKELSNILNCCMPKRWLKKFLSHGSVKSNEELQKKILTCCKQKHGICTFKFHSTFLFPTIQTSALLFKTLNPQNQNQKVPDCN